MNVKEQKVLVVGTGISGIGAASLLVKQGAKVILYDQNEKLKEEDVRQNSRRAWRRILSLEPCRRNCART